VGTRSPPGTWRGIVTCVATFDDTVRSQARSRPIILYSITSAGQTFNLTLNGTDVKFGGVTYTAITASHEDEDISQDASGNELILHLPITHPIVQRYAATGIPDQSVRVTVYELQSDAIAAALAWSGVAQSMSIGLNMADLRVPTVTADALRIQLPVITAQPNCNHVLFNAQCSPNPGGDWPVAFTGSGHGGPIRSVFQFATTVITMSNDKTMTIGLPAADQFFRFGKIFGIVSGELQTRSIVDQSGTLITIDVPFAASFDDVLGANYTVEAGCDHSPSTCVSKFGNIANYGGHPTMNNQHNIWGPAGLGILQQV